MVYPSDENLAAPQPENQHQQPDEGERQRRNKLKTHRRYRTQTRNLLKTNLQSIIDLHSETPRFPDGIRPEAVACQVKLHAAKIEELNLKISDLIDDEAEWEAEELHSGAATREAVAAVVAVDAAMIRLSKPPAAAEDASRNLNPASSHDGTETPVSSGGALSDKLARVYDMTPRKFSGDRLQFRTFLAEFEEYVGHRNDVSALRKLIILRKFLEGEPRIIIEALELNNANYAIALSLLEKNYARVGSEKIRVIGELRNLPIVTKPFDHVSISRLVTTVQSHISILAVNGVTPAEFSLTLFDAMQSALPIRVRQEFLDCQQADEKYGGRSSGDCSPSASTGVPLSAGAKAAKDVEDLIEFLRQRLRNIERLKQDSAAQTPVEKKQHENHPKASDSKKRQSTTIAAVSAAPNARDSSGRKPKSCLFCKSVEHVSSRCDADLTLTQRVGILRKLNRCETCFRTKHGTSSECKGPRSTCSTCKSVQHYTAMHSDSAEASTTAAVGGTVSAVVNEGVGIRDALLWTACAFVVNNNRRIPIRIFIDPGSSITVATPSLCRELGEPAVGKCDLAVQAFASNHARQNVPIYTARLIGPDGSANVSLDACEHTLGVDPPNVAPSHVLSAIRTFNKRYPVADLSYLGTWKAEAPMILLGMDQSHKLLVAAKPEVVIDNIQGHQSKFGWIIGGPIPISVPGHLRVQAASISCAAVTPRNASRLTAPAKAVEALWTFETLGIMMTPAATSLSADEESAVLQFQSALSYSENRYTTAIPKRPSISSLLNNHATAAQRLERKLIQLKRDPARYTRYHAEILKFVEKGYAREIQPPASASISINDGCFYMPHHEVTSVTDTAEKWRIVFDCSAKSKGGSSLNDHLLVGPSLGPDLITLLLNFRLHPVAVSADITQAYMMIAVEESDQRYFRFLWRYPGENKTRTFQMQRLTWGAAPSGFILAAVIREHFKRSGPDVGSKYGSRFYADDYLSSYRDESEAAAATDGLRRILSTAGMNLAKWKSNSPTLMRHLTSTGVHSEALDAGNNGVFKVLGLSWLASADVFKFTMPNLSQRVSANQRNTKRETLSIVASVYDPLGWLMPFSLRGKHLIQKIWSEKLEWNQPISADHQEELIAWVHELEAFNRHRIPRQFVPSSRTPRAYRLHVFGDASPVAYAAAAYLEAMNEDDPPAFSLLMSRSRLAPLEAQTLPRLELMAALIAVRLKSFLSERLEIRFDPVRFYTDSMITYYWVTSENPGNFKQFICNRVREIQENSCREQWFHLAGLDNVADLATRGLPAVDLVQSSSWWNAPSWLRLPEDQHPISQPRAASSEAGIVAQAELRQTMASILREPEHIELNRYRSMSHACRVFALVIRFVARCRRQEIESAELYNRAERQLIVWTQERHFREEIALTRAGERAPAASKLGAVSLFIDADGLLRIKTRLTERSQLPHETKNPIVLPGESSLAALYIADAHRLNAHFGVTTVLSYLRRRFWITRGRQVIKAILSRCVICKKKQARHADQVEAPLPDVRADLQDVFRTTGVDFFGPYHTKHREGTLKTYVLLFSCTATRAIHLEAVPTMTAPQTGLAIRRFLASYPACRCFISDNGRSFVRTAADLHRLFKSVKSPETQDLLQTRLIQWRFNTPRASWHGGFFERFVGVAKAALFKTLGRSLIGYEEFRTILSEICAVINSRPLTYVSNDSDSPEPLTPAHFLKAGPPHVPIVGIAPIDKLASDECATASELRAATKHRTTYFRSLCSRWLREYLLLLRSANSTRGRVRAPLAVGEICLLHEDNQPRIKWQLVRIIEQHIGRDGNVRVYSIRLPSGKTTRRAAQLLYPLEVSEQVVPTERPSCK